MARVEGAKGPDREIDCLLWGLDTRIEALWVGNQLCASFEGAIGSIDPGKVARNFTCYRGADVIPAYTASLDAALALVERAGGEKLPMLGEALEMLVWDINRGLDATTVTISDIARRVIAALLRSLVPEGGDLGACSAPDSASVAEAGHQGGAE